MRVTPRVEIVASVVAVLAVLEILIGLWWGSWRGQGGSEYGGVVVAAFPVLVGALALSRSGLSRALSTRPMVHGGRISYSLYLVHVPIFEIFWTMMAWHPRIGPGSALGEFLVPQVFLLALVVADLSYRYLEEPGRGASWPRGPGRWARRDPRVTVSSRRAPDLRTPACQGESPRRPDPRRLFRVDGRLGT